MGRANSQQPANAKWTVAKIIGGGAVTLIGGAIVKEVLGGPAAAGVVGGVILMIAHEELDAPVSRWVYRQL